MATVSKTGILARLDGLVTVSLRNLGKMRESGFRRGNLTASNQRTLLGKHGDLAASF